MTPVAGQRRAELVPGLCIPWQAGCGETPPGGPDLSLLQHGCNALVAYASWLAARTRLHLDEGGHRQDKLAASGVFVSEGL